LSLSILATGATGQRRIKWSGLESNQQIRVIPTWDFLSDHIRR
jgi:hypothetical protein